MNLRIPALVLSLAAVGLGFALWREHSAKAALAAENTRLYRQIAELRYDAKQAARQAAEFNRHAVELDTQLGSAKVRTTASESRQVLLARALNEREQREVALMAELASLRQKSADASAAAQPPAPAGEVAAYRRRITELEAQLTQLLTRALAESPVTPASEPATPTAPYQVVRVGPRDAFAVLDYGAAHGARAGQILSLWRGTSEVARVQISDARPRFSLAQVLSASLKGQLQTGDLVVLTN